MGISYHGFDVERCLSPRERPILPRLPGTRTMYSTSGSRTSCVGFRGYVGGFDASVVRDDRDRAKVGAVCIGDMSIA
jgi:hypothetical protein